MACQRALSKAILPFGWFSSPPTPPHLSILLWAGRANVNRKEALPPLDEQVKSIKLKNPIVQQFAGTRGVYRQMNLEKRRVYNLPQWRALCESSTDHQRPAERGEVWSPDGRSHGRKTKAKGENTVPPKMQNSTPPPRPPRSPMKPASPPKTFPPSQRITTIALPRLGILLWWMRRRVTFSAARAESPLIIASRQIIPPDKHPRSHPQIPPRQKNPRPNAPRPIHLPRTIAP
jgi:hypothetical protein